MMRHPFFEILRHELETALRTRRFLVLFVLVQLLVVGGGGCIVELAVRAEAEARTYLGEHEGSDATVELLQDALRRGVVSAAAEVHALEVEAIRPTLSNNFMVPLLLWLALAGLPWLTGLVAYDVVSAQLGRRSLRYALVRTHVGWWLAGRLSALSIMLVASLLVAFTAVLWMSASRLGEPPLLQAAFPLFLLGLGLGAWTVVHVCMAGLVSSFFRTGLPALMTWAAVLVGLGMLNTTWFFSGAFQRLTPAWWQWGLWARGLGSVTVTLMVWTLFAALTFAATVAVLRRREM